MIGVDVGWTNERNADDVGIFNLSLNTSGIRTNYEIFGWLYEYSLFWYFWLVEKSSDNAAFALVDWEKYA